MLPQFVEFISPEGKKIYIMNTAIVGFFPSKDSGNCYVEYKCDKYCFTEIMETPEKAYAKHINSFHMRHPGELIPKEK